MNLSYRISAYISNWIRKHNPGSSSEAVHAYALVPWINLIPCVVAIAAICTITGDLLQGFLSTTAFIVLRQFSGGVHFRSATKCNIVSTLFILSAVYLPAPYWDVGFVLNVLAAIFMMTFSPSHVKRHEIGDTKLIMPMRIVSVLLVCSNFFWQNPVLSWVCFIQSCLSLPYVHRLADRLKL